MFLQNDVLHYPDAPGRLIRILWIDQAAAIAYIYQLRRADAVPRPIPLHVLRADVSAHRARLLLPDPFRPRAVAAPSTRHLRLQLKAWAAVRALHQTRPNLYQPRLRPAMLAAYGEQHALSATSLMRYLRRYWERGQTIEALLPDYGNSGARGKARAILPGVKRGRPRNGAIAGPNVDAALRAVFQAAAAHYAAHHQPFSRPAAYRQMLADYFGDCAPEAIPSYGQFNYWLTRDGSPAPR